MICRLRLATTAALCCWVWTCNWIVSAASMEDLSKNQSSPIPLIDIEPWVHPLKSSDSARLEVSQQIRKACEDIGFFAIINHGVDPHVLAEAWSATKKFFDMPLEEKQFYSTTNEAEYPYGYEKSETLTMGKAKDSSWSGVSTEASDSPPPPDLKETFAIGPSNPASGMPPRKFPKAPAEMKSAYERYYSAMEDLSHTLLRIFASSLSLAESWFEDKMDHHLCALRTLNYPPLEAKPLEGQLRAGAHTDYGAFTILKSGGPGLQVTKDSKSIPPEEQAWVDVPFLSNAFIINLGDLMQRWTNDKWVSTLHRVVVPPPDNRNVRRQSMAFFVNMNSDANVVPIETCVDAENPPRYGSITAGEHLMSKHLASMGISPETKDEL